MHLSSDYVKERYITYPKLRLMYFLEVIGYPSSLAGLCQHALISSMAKSSSSTPIVWPGQ